MERVRYQSYIGTTTGMMLHWLQFFDSGGRKKKELKFLDLHVGAENGSAIVQLCDCVTQCLATWHVVFP